MPSAAAAAAWLGGLALLAAAGPAARPAAPAGGPPLQACPREVGQKSARASSASTKVELTFQNQTPVPLEIVWIDTRGAEKVTNENLPPGKSAVQSSFVGHVFAAREPKSRTLVKVVRASEEDAQAGRPAIVIPVCKGLLESVKAVAPPRRPDQSRWKEFEQLARDHGSPCVGHSKEWSCVRRVTEAEVKQRDPALYGFSADETGSGNPYKRGATADHVWMSQQRYIVNVTNQESNQAPLGFLPLSNVPGSTVTDYEGGYLKMHMTDKMKSLLYPWYQERLRDSVRKHDPIPGFFTNSHKVAMDKIEITRFPAVYNGLVQEMKQVLEWWTNQTLQHTTTFGLRVYRRGSMLINHLDRKDTHVASAVIQVGARADVGWPLEVIHPHKTGLAEVYLQPGEMVLYEGARVVHGRPMRFQGEEFGNIFSHFKPVDWNGPTDWENPYFRLERDKLRYSDLEL
ncbi:unnamed protein product [Prorocentrum cordatum]|uniref:Uncharacterized protein n=1 Tax=Prorocentrum cordatum TaxID=2364126 RepID=A0ABN9QXB6_9DINO|nr:unnamed protein product [Polarella glacialis]